MLIIEIALGIVLAVIIINYWRSIIGWGILGALTITSLVFVSGVGYFIYNYWDSITSFIPSLLVVIGFITSAFIIYLVIEKLGARLSIHTLEKWNLTASESVTILYTMIILTIGIILTLRAVFIENSFENSAPLGALLLIAGVVIALDHRNNIYKNREERKIK